VNRALSFKAPREAAGLLISVVEPETLVQRTWGGACARWVSPVRPRELALKRPFRGYVMWPSPLLHHGPARSIPLPFRSKPFVLHHAPTRSLPVLQTAAVHCDPESAQEGKTRAGCSWRRIRRY